MAQYDVFRMADGSLVVDCQTDAFADIPTRLAAPLVRTEDSPIRQPRLNPVFSVDNEDWVLMTQFAGAVRIAELRNKAGSVEKHRLAIIGAFDMLLTGV